MENLRKPLQWSFVVTVLGCTGVFGCANEKSDVNDQNQDELNGILKDGELTALSRSALRVSPPPTGVGGAVVIMPGLGGSTGSAGAGGRPGGVDGGVTDTGAQIDQFPYKSVAWQQWSFN